MKLKTLLSLCFVWVSIYAHAKTQNLEKWLNYFDSNGIKIFYSSDFLSDFKLNALVDLEEPFKLDDFNQELHTFTLKLHNIDKNIYVIQASNNQTQVHGGLIVEVMDAETNENINNYKLQSDNNNRNTTDGLIFIDSNNSTHFSITINSQGYYSQNTKTDIKSGEFRMITIRLKPKPINLNKVIVTASQFNFNHPQSSFKSLDRSDLEHSISISNDPLTSVNNIAGNSGNGISGITRTRGGNQNEALITFDNNNLRNPYHFKSFFSLTSVINSSIVDGLDFYSGVFPAQFGGRLSSVIVLYSDDNLTKPTYEIGADGLNLYTTYRYSNADYSQQFLSSLRSGGQLIKSLFVENFIVKPKFEDAYFKASQQINTNWQSSQHLLLSRDETSFKRGDIEDLPADLEQALADYQDQNLWFQWHYNNQQSMQANILFYANHKNDLRKGSLDNDVSHSSVFEKINSSYYGIKYKQQNSLNDRWSLNFGLDVFKEQTHINYTKHINQDNQLLQQLGLVRNFNRLFIFQNTGFGSKFFINNRFQLSKKIIFDLGIRLEYKDWIKENINSPRFNLSYFYDKNTTIRIGLGRHQQSQYIDELLLEDENPQYLKPASADVVVLELNKKLNDKLSLRAELYQKEYSHTQPFYENTFNNLQVLPDLYFDRNRITPDDSSATGIELTLFGTFKNINWSSSYIFSDVHDAFDVINNDGIEEHQTQSRSWDQHHALKFNLHIPMRSWSLDLISNFHSGWPKTSITQTQQGLQVGQRNQDTFNQHIQFDFKLSKHIKTSKGQLKMSLQANNIFNNANICCVNYSLEQGQLRAQEKQWLPIIPNFSVIYNWD